MDLGKALSRYPACQVSRWESHLSFVAPRWRFIPAIFQKSNTLQTHRDTWRPTSYNNLVQLQLQQWKWCFIRTNRAKSRKWSHKRGRGHSVGASRELIFQALPDKSDSSRTLEFLAGPGDLLSVKIPLSHKVAHKKITFSEGHLIRAEVPNERVRARLWDAEYRADLCVQA